MIALAPEMIADLVEQSITNNPQSAWTLSQKFNIPLDEMQTILAQLHDEAGAKETPDGWLIEANKPTLAQIRVDGGTQPRVTNSETTIAYYKERMREGAKFDPIVVFYDGVSYWLADGFHRYFAAHEIGYDLDIEVKQGTKRNAILFSCGANSKHGLQRSPDDLRKAILTVLNDPDWRKWTNVEIGKHCDCSEGSVRKKRKFYDWLFEKLEGSSAYVRQQISIIINDPRKLKAELNEFNSLSKKSYNTNQKEENAIADYQSVNVEVNINQPEKVKTSSALPPIRSDVHNAICKFLGVDRAIEEPRLLEQPSVYLLGLDNDDLEFHLEHLLSALKGDKVKQAIVVTSNLTVSLLQNILKTQSDSYCAIGNSKVFCSYILWYFSPRDKSKNAKFLGTFSGFGLVGTVLDDEQ